MTSNPASVGPAPDGLLPCPDCDRSTIIPVCATCGGLGLVFHPDREAEPTGGVVLKTFPPEKEGVQSRYVLVHQLRASADIQDSETKRTTGWATTSDRAQLMRKAATALEGLAALSVSPPVVEGSSLRDTQPGASLTVLVPIEPTEAMLNAAWDLMPAGTIDADTRAVWSAMIEAARHQPTSPGEQE